MNRLKTIATWIPLIPQLKYLHNSHVIMQVLNTTSLCQHNKDINYDHNLQIYHILCLIKTKMHHTSIGVHKFINSSKYSYISIHDGDGLMMMYDIHMHLDSFNIIISDGSKYIATTFNTNTWKAIHIVCVYKVHSCSISTFLNNLPNIIQSSLWEFLMLTFKKIITNQKRKIIIFHG
jgi:hypothetical protein